MKVKVKTVGEALHPSEVVIELDTRDGSEKLAVSKKMVHNEMLDVGNPVGNHSDFFLVELPRETFRGFWRVWISNDRLESAAQS